MAVNQTQMQVIEAVMASKESIRASSGLDQTNVDKLLRPLEAEIRACAEAEAKLKAAQDELKTAYLALCQKNVIKNYGSGNNDCMLLSLCIEPNKVKKFRSTLFNIYSFIFTADFSRYAIQDQNQVNALKRQLYQYAAGQDMSEDKVIRQQQQEAQEKEESELIQQLNQTMNLSMTEDELATVLKIVAQRRNGENPKFAQRYASIIGAFEVEIEVAFLKKRLDPENRFLDVADAQLAAIMLNADIYIYDNHGSRQRVYANGKDKEFEAIRKQYAAL